MADIQEGFAPGTKVEVQGLSYIVIRYLGRGSFGAFISWMRSHDSKLLNVKLVPRGTAMLEDALMVELLIYTVLYSHCDGQLFAHAFRMDLTESDWMRMTREVTYACTCCCYCCC